MALTTYVRALCPFPENLLTPAFCNYWFFCLLLICLFLSPTSIMQTPQEWELCVAHILRPRTVLDRSRCSGNRIFFHWMKERMKTLRCLSGPKVEKHLGVSQPSPEVLFTLKNPGLGWREWEMWRSPGLEPLHGRRIRETGSTGGALGRSSGRAGKWAALVPKRPGRRLWNLTRQSQLIGTAPFLSSQTRERKVRGLPWWCSG